MAFMGVTVRCANCSQEIDIFGISNVSLDIEVFPSVCECIRAAMMEAILEQIREVEEE